MHIPQYKRQDNNQVAVINMKSIIDDIRTSYPHETFMSMAGKIGIATGTIKTWFRTGRARQKEANSLISAYPIPPVLEAEKETIINDGKGIGNPVHLSVLFDQVTQGLLEIRERLGV